MPNPLRLGILYPLHSAEDDYPFLASSLVPPVEVRVVHTHGEDMHEVEACRQTGSRENLAPGLKALAGSEIDVCIWACTSGSFVYGLEGAREQAENIANELGVPASSTSLAFLNALHALGLTSVTVAATYPEDLAHAFRSFLQEGGVEVLHLGCRGIWTAVEVGGVGRQEVVDFAVENDHPGAEAVLIPDTALHTARFLADLETHVGKTVLTANAVTIWEALRLGGYATPQTGFGRLMTLL